MPSIAIVLLAAVALLTPGTAAASLPHDRWRRPLDGAAVVRTFSFDPATPYAGGRRRGIDLRGRPDAPVGAACSGRVSYAGRVPGWGLGATVRCARGGLVATELGLGAVGVRRGAPVLAGAVLGRLGARGVLRLGARRAGARQGYVDPLALLGGEDPVAPPGVARRVRRRARPPAPRARPLPIVTTDAPVRLPWPIWPGLGLLAAGAGGGSVARRRGRPRPVPGASLAHRYR